MPPNHLLSLLDLASSFFFENAPLFFGEDAYAIRHAALFFVEKARRLPARTAP
jgi:hypothetical protein